VIYDVTKINFLFWKSIISPGETFLFWAKRGLWFHPPQPQIMTSRDAKRKKMFKNGRKKDGDLT